MKYKVETVATNLEVPWSLRFAPDGRLFFTERPGRIRVIVDGKLREEPVATLDVAQDTAEGGQLGLALDPNFAQNGYIYVMYTYSGSNGLTNRISRMTVRDNHASDEKVLLDGIPAATIHDGGRLGFGPDGKLYATTGDATNEDNAQDLDSLSGKILRLNPDGSIPKDNPFPNSPVYSYGHRNSEGFDWQPRTNKLYETENGPVGNDEVNLIQPGKNYGWPVVVGRSDNPKYVNPLLLYNPSIAPEGATFYNADAIPQWKGDFFFATLRGEHLHRVNFENGKIAGQERLFENKYGRIRAVAVGPDGSLYFTTSNRDGRGNPGPQDDRIMRIVPEG